MEGKTILKFLGIVLILLGLLSILYNFIISFDTFNFLVSVVLVIVGLILSGKLTIGVFVGGE